MASAAEPLQVKRAGLLARSTIGPLLMLALMMTIGFAALGSFGTIQEAAKAELGLGDDHDDNPGG